MDPNLLAKLFEQTLDPALTSDRALALFGKLIEKNDTTWTVRPSHELTGIREILLCFYLRNQATEPPEDIDLILSVPWEITVSKLEAIFGGSALWLPAGPAPGRHRLISIARPGSRGRLEGVVLFELNKNIRDKTTEDLSIVRIRFRPLP